MRNKAAQLVIPFLLLALLLAACTPSTPTASPIATAPVATPATPTPVPAPGAEARKEAPLPIIQVALTNGVPQEVIDHLKLREDWKDYVYLDSLDHLTVGLGHKLTESEKTLYKVGDTVTLPHS